MDVFAIEKPSGKLKQVENPVHRSHFVAIQYGILEFLAAVNSNLISSVHQDLLYF